MRLLPAICVCAAVISARPAIIHAQDLEPRAYSISPVGVNFVVWGLSHSSGDLVFDPTLPVEDARGRINGAVIGYFRSIDLLGRSANVTFVLPYVWGTAEGLLAGEPAQIYRSGLADSRFRLAINIKGAPAMHAADLAKSRARTTIGASVIVMAPTGQYDPNKIINIGNNRWTFKPEIGYSRLIRRRWVLDAYAGAWLFTPNGNFQGVVRNQAPLVSTQFHLSYSIRRRLWAAFDGTYYVGGRTTVAGIRKEDRQNNSRVGFTVSSPLARRQSLKFAFSTGAHVNIGGKFRTFAVSWQYMWGGGM